ncbi:MAG: hypothetical protein HY270_01235 [Deltaproteobacteria bacterium]|nr:hypothetical protein [Deltaproteobacteria bacterium]
MTRRIDLMEDFVHVFDHEQMVAFFEIQCPRADAEPLRGLCRVSKPKTQATMRYLSLSFMIDTADDAARVAADACLGRLEGEAMTAVVSMITSVMSMPVSATTAENYVRQMDVMLDEHVDPGRFFIEQRLVPALRQLAQIQTGEIVWWGELAEDRPLEPAVTASGADSEGLGARLRRYLGGHCAQR